MKRPVRSVAEQVREALVFSGERSVNAAERAAFLALAEALTEPGADRLRRLLR